MSSTTVYVGGRASQCARLHGRPQAAHAFRADTLVHTNIFAKYYADNITNEDCWWWRSNDGHYHALTHRMTPADREGVESGGHAFATSLDNCACQ